MKLQKTLVLTIVLETVLSYSAIWICVGCHTCSIQCPNNIDIPSMMDSLCQEALSHNIKPTEPDILNFHNEVLRSVNCYARTHKMEIMMRYKLIKRNFTEDVNVELKILAMAFGYQQHAEWFAYHLIDPIPMLNSRKLNNCSGNPSGAEV